MAISSHWISSLSSALPVEEEKGSNIFSLKLAGEISMRKKLESDPFGLFGQIERFWKHGWPMVCQEEREKLLSTGFLLRQIEDSQISFCDGIPRLIFHKKVCSFRIHHLHVFLWIRVEKTRRRSQF